MIGWSSPTSATQENKIVTLKPEQSWSIEEDRLANSNFKALNAIFTVVDVTQFKLITACESAKDA